MRVIRHSTNGPRPVHSGFQGKSDFCVQREREPTDRVNIVRELRKESFEDRVERARETNKRVVKGQRAEKEIDMRRGRYGNEEREK